MRIYGTGCLTAPGTSRVVHDFADGPFDTVNQDLIKAAFAQGFSDKEPVYPTVVAMLDASQETLHKPAGPGKPVTVAKRKYTKKAKK